MPSLTSARVSRLLRWSTLDFSAVPDPRDRRGRRHAHAPLLTLLVGALAAGARTLRSVEELSEDLTRGARRALGLRPSVSDTALYELLVRQTPALLAGVLEGQVKTALASKALRHDLFGEGVLAWDGKQSWVGKEPANPACQQRTAPTSGEPYFQLFAQRVALVSSSARPVVYQDFIGDKTNEVASFGASFQHVNARFGRSFGVVTGDAGNTSRENAALVASAGKAYYFAVKGNQPTLHATAQHRLGTQEDAADEQRQGEATSYNQAQGATVIREAFGWTLTVKEVDVPSARQLWRIRQTRQRRDETGQLQTQTVEDRYFITSRSWSAEQALKLTRLHWGIENGPNWTADMVLGEDDSCPCQQGHGVQVVSWLRLLAYNLVAMWRTKLPRQHGETTSWAKAQHRLRDALRGFTSEGELAAVLG
jgi:predicted transposase YbfD/YdcC